MDYKDNCVFYREEFSFEEKGIVFCIWSEESCSELFVAGLVLIAWHYLFGKKVQRETKSDVLRFVTKIMI